MNQFNSNNWYQSKSCLIIEKTSFIPYLVFSLLFLIRQFMCTYFIWFGFGLLFKVFGNLCAHISYILCFGDDNHDWNYHKFMSMPWIKLHVFQLNFLCDNSLSIWTIFWNKTQYQCHKCTVKCIGVFSLDLIFNLLDFNLIPIFW
jgi:hypothetical protein